MSSQHAGVLVVGGGMAGISAAVESAELGHEVYLVEKAESLGGKVAGMHRYFPKLCPPYCGLEINYRRIKENPRISVFTSAEVTKIEGTAGDYTATVKIRPRYIAEDLTDPIGPYADLEKSVPNGFNFGMDKKRAVQVPHELAFPYLPVVDSAVFSNPELKAKVEGLPGVDLTQQDKEMTLKVGSVIWAAGWTPYEVEKVDYLGYHKYPDVITNLEMERLAAVNGPTGGKLLRPSDGKPVKRAAFVQCAGSRDEHHLPYCSTICCMGSLKQSSYVRESDPESEVWIFYIDIRANRYEAFYRKVQDDKNVHLIKGKPGRILRNAAGDMVVVSEDMNSDGIVEVPVDLVVLASGMVPATATEKVPYFGADTLVYDKYGFMAPDQGNAAIYPAGCVKRPVDVASTVQDASAAALKATRE